MIKAYEENIKVSNAFINVEEYIKATTKVNNPKDVIRHIKDYLNRNIVTLEDKVTDFLNQYLLNFNLLNKTHIVCDGSYRNCVILIRPDDLGVTHSPVSYNSLEDDLKLFEKEAETIFLILNDKTWEEVNEEWDYYDGLYSSEDDWFDFEDENQ